MFFDNDGSFTTFVSTLITATDSNLFNGINKMFTNNRSKAPSTLKESKELVRPKYRADIDGLRAVAVLLVVGFHAFPDLIKGGFIGVDIFFVISGFLISTIIYQSMEKDKFSFMTFYRRRVQRIFPALFIIFVFCFIFGWFVLWADEYKQLGKHIAGGAGFISNFIFWNESSYFDNLAETKPLLHLWSLGIEEQFYFFWPLILWGAMKKKINLLGVTLTVILISFLLNIKGFRTDTVATFYSPQTRFWEMLCGSLLAWITLYKPNAFSDIKNKIIFWIGKNIYRGALEVHASSFRNAQSILGILLIIFSLFRLTKKSYFPGIWALFPTLGAVLIISAGSYAWLNRTVLSNRVLVWFGLISFPLYLWHWPLLSFARIIESNTPSVATRTSLVVLSIILAWLTYKLIEKPLRASDHSNMKFFTLILLMILIGGIGYFTEFSNGYPLREVNNLSAVKKDSGSDGDTAGAPVLNKCGLSSEEQNLFSGCYVDSRQPVKYALLGDSKAGALISGLIRTSTRHGRWIFIGGNGKNGTSTPVISNNEIYKSNQLLTPLAVKTISLNKNIEKVVLVAAIRQLFQLKNDVDINDLQNSKNYDVALEGLQNTIDVLKKAKKKIVIVEDNPTLPHPEDCLQRSTSANALNYLFSFSKSMRNEKCFLSMAHHLESSRKYRNLLSDLEKRNSGDVVIFYTAKILCDEKFGVCEISKNGRLLYGITDHVSDYGAGWSCPYLNGHFV